MEQATAQAVDPLEWHEYDLPDAPLTENREDVDAWADSLLERIADLQAEIKGDELVAARRYAMIDSWLADQVEPRRRRIAYLERELRALAEGYDFGRKKSRNLPSGTFGWRRGRERLEIDDVDAAVEFVLHNDLKAKIVPLKDPLMAHFKATGEVPAGCRFVDAEDEFYVRAER